MVVFEDGQPRTGEYRRFRIKGVQGQDDFASHQEVLRRRFRRALDAEEGGAEQLRWRMPDLVIIDGGKGQVSAAREVLDELGLHDLPMAGLAKEREELFLPGRSRAHRAAGHLAARCTCCSGCATRPTASPSPTTASCAPRRPPGRRSMTWPGVGPARKRALLRVFGSSRAPHATPASRRSPRCPASGPSLADRIREHLDS